MFTRSAKYYDALYRALGKDYAQESAHLTELLNGHGVPAGSALLDVACGTGAHLEHLRERFQCEGLDIEPAMLALAEQRCPGIPLHRADMISFNLGKRYDAIVCMFSSIAYAPSPTRLDQTLQTFARHLRPGGVIVVEPWFSPGDWENGRLAALFVDDPDLKVARMNVARVDGNVSILNFHFMVGSADGIRSFTEPHRLTLFTDEEYLHAFRIARFDVEFDPEGPMGRGLYVGTLR